jgi:hypothetical protein
MESYLEHTFDSLPTPRNIRLATLLPGQPDDDLKINLETQHLDSDPQYEAVSYNWGEVNRDHSVMCEEGVIMVTGNIVGVLRRFRLTQQPRTLWIDTLCINQSDLEEKSQQVSIMGDIYSQAKNVLIWLGEEDDDTELAYETINSLVHTNPQHQAVLSSILSLTPTAIKALLSLLNRPWFHRAWIFQESILARNSDIITGRYIFSRDALWRLSQKQASYLDSRFHSPDGSFDSNLYEFYTRLRRCRCLLQTDFKVYPGTTRMGILQLLLSQRRGAEAYDPRDIIYSLLGVERRYSLSSVDIICKPDYETPWHEVFISTTKQIIIDTCSLTILRETGIKNQLCPLPSWVPDWRKSVFECATSLQDKYASINCKPSMPFAVHRQPIKNLGVDGKCLSLRGHCIGRVCSFLSHLPSSTPAREPFQDLKTFIFKNPLYPITGEATLNTLCQLIDPAARWKEDYLRESTHWFNPSQHRTEPDLQQAISDSQLDTNFLEAIEKKHRVFITDKGYLGIAREATRAGDEVYSLLGTHFLFLLRKSCESSKDDGKFVLVGECRVHGLMRGEAFDVARNAVGLESGDFSKEDYEVKPLVEEEMVLLTEEIFLV